MPLNANYNPASVMVNAAPTSGALKVKDPIKGPYTTGGEIPKTNPTTIGAQSVRATGSGPFDSAYRQNLATYAGGLFNRPGGNLSFNPTGNLSDLGGQALGGGNAPIYGGPQSLLSMAIGNQAQPNQSTVPPKYTAPSNWQQWLNQYGNFLGNRGPQRFLGA